jgi:hypothetical protein
MPAACALPAAAAAACYLLLGAALWLSAAGWCVNLCGVALECMRMTWNYSAPT